MSVSRAWEDRDQPQCQSMMDFTDFASVASDPAALLTDRLRLAVAAYPGRFTGSSREHTESDLRCYLTWRAEQDLDPRAAPRYPRNRRPWGSPTCSSRPCSPPPGSHPTTRTTLHWWPCSACSGCGYPETTSADIAHLGEEHGHRVLRVHGKGTKVVLVPLPPAVGRAVDRAIGLRDRGPILLNSRGARMDRHAATRRLRQLAETRMASRSAAEDSASR